jgi:hypothetical protein
MKDAPIPWFDQEVPQELRRLLEAARSQEPTAAAIQRVSAKLALARTASLATEAGGLTTIAGAATGTLTVKSSLLGGGLIGVIGVGMAVIGLQRFTATPGSHQPERGSARPTIASANGIGALPPPIPIESEPSRPVAAAATARHAIGQPAPATPNRKSRTAEPMPSCPIASPSAMHDSRDSTAERAIAHETVSPYSAGARVVYGLSPEPPEPEEAPRSESSFIDQARVALNHQKPNRVLEILDQYERVFSRRTFAPEAMQLRMRAFQAQGNGAASRRVAEALVRLYGDTPQGKEARELLDR